MSIDEIKFRDLKHGDMGWIIKTHGELYYTEFGWDHVNLEILTAEIVLDFAKNHSPKNEKVWIAYNNKEERLGCIFIVKENETTAKIRLVLVTPKARGLGLGSKLVEKALNFSKNCGYENVVLWTHSDLVSARKIYQSNGFKLISEEKHSRFGPELTGQMWHLKLK